MQQIAVVIPVRDNKRLTRACLDSLAEHAQGHQMQVVVVDNDSHDGTRSELRERYRWVQVLRNTTNLGYGPAANRGVAESSGEYVCVINNDTLALGDWVSPLMATLNDESVGVTGPFGGFLSPDFRPVAMATGPRRVADYIEGSCLMMRRCDWDALGGFDPIFAPAYYEDTDLSFRVRRDLAKDATITPGVPFRHLGGKTTQQVYKDTGAGSLIETNRQKLQSRYGGRCSTLLRSRPGVALVTVGGQATTNRLDRVKWEETVGSVSDVTRANWALVLRPGERIATHLADLLWRIVSQTQVHGATVEVRALGGRTFRDLRIVRVGHVREVGVDGMPSAVAGDSILEVSGGVGIEEWDGAWERPPLVRIGAPAMETRA